MVLVFWLIKGDVRDRVFVVFAIVYLQFEDNQIAGIYSRCIDRTIDEFEELAEQFVVSDDTNKFMPALITS